MTDRRYGQARRTGGSSEVPLPPRPAWRWVGRTWPGCRERYTLPVQPPRGFRTHGTSHSLILQARSNARGVRCWTELPAFDVPRTGSLARVTDRGGRKSGESVSPRRPLNCRRTGSGPRQQWNQRLPKTNAAVREAALYSRRHLREDGPRDEADGLGTPRTTRFVQRRPDRSDAIWWYCSELISPRA